MDSKWNIEGEGSSSSTPCWNHDVFLSFRGEDTRKNFTDHLYAALVRNGINTFRDDDELKRGEYIASALLKAIEKSKISIIIFSRNYASSKWCLDELVKIIECRETKRQKVLPVFYDVDPSDVRKQSGIFGEAFARQENRFKLEIEKVNKWRRALKEAGSLSGWDVRNGYESKFIQSIVDKVLSNLNQPQFNVAQYQVGLESRLEKMKSLLNVGSDDIRIVGICGMGGIGKTTIAKAVFNLFSRRFEGCSFLANVREQSGQPNGLLYLQEQLLSDILTERNMKITSVDRGVNMISEKLFSKRILLVLDDVDQLRQLNALVGKRNWFGLGSRIIITTRDMHLLNNIKVDEVYKVKELNMDESLKLFSWHAFGNDHPTNDYLEVSKSIVGYVNGLPLALEVLGAFLFDKGISEYESALEKLKRVPYHEIQSKLRISYDGLNDNLVKDIFLDIACFFIGMDKDCVIGILDGCGFYPIIGITILIHKSLITINEMNQVMMHDLLRDMGRKIVQEESQKEPGERSRLWFHKDIYDVLTKHTGTMKVEGLTLNMLKVKVTNYIINTEAFAKMQRLRLLQINHVHVTGNYQHFSKELRWLCWHGFPLNSIPTNFHLENLVILDLQYSNVKYLWNGIKMLKKLKVLNFSHSHGLTQISDLSGLTMVEKLVFEDCRSLVGVHHSIGQLERLVFLSLKDCGNLRSLPNSICELKSLENLILCGCLRLEKLPEELGNMRCLRELIVDNTAIQELPLSIGHLKNLRCLSLNGCNRSTSRDWTPFIWFWNSTGKIPHSTTLLPNSLVGLSSLRILKMRNCNLLDDVIPSEIGSMCSLQHLDIGDNKFLSLPASINRLSLLKYLGLQNCTRLQFLPQLPSSLVKLVASGCKSMERLVSPGNLSSLQELVLSETFSYSHPGNISHLTRLKYLDLLDCTRLKSLPELPSSLEELNAQGCTSLERLPNFECLSSLVELNIDNSNIRTLPACLSRCSQLLYLDLNNCSRLQVLPELPSSLEVLYASGCTSLEQLPNFESFSSLVELNINNSNIRTLPACLVRFSQLESLNVDNCSKLQVLPELPSSLKCLYARDCTLMERLPNLSNCHMLDLLDLENCRMLTEIQGFENLKSVQSIYMKGCNNLPNNFKSSLIQGLCGRDKFHICVPGSKVPDWFYRRSMGSSLFFEVPPLLDGKIQGLTVCAVWTGIEESKDFGLENWPIIIIHNKTKGPERQVHSIYSINDIVCEDELWVAHIPHIDLNYQLEHGDQIEVSVEIGKRYQVKECGVNIVYVQDEKCSQPSDGEALIGCSSSSCHFYAVD